MIAMIAASCASSSKLMQKGRYDEAIDKAVKKLIKNPDDTKQAKVLDKSYRLANERDRERIRYLKLENNPDNWNEIFRLYSNLKSRQTGVRPVLPLRMHGRLIEYKYVDYDLEIVEAKRNAAEYFYHHAQDLMNNNDKASYRQACGELIRASEYSGGSFPDLDRMIEETRYRGTSRALVRVLNSTHLKLPQDFMDELLSISTGELNSEWVEYHFKHLDDDINYDYLINVNIQSVGVSPDHVNETDHLIEKEAEDGFEYVLDQNGNVMKDTLGNDIKVKKYKTLSCTVIESRQHKSAMVKGEVEFIQNNPGKLLKKQPIAAEHIFEHTSARAIGREEILDEEMTEMVEREFIPFPHDMDMIIQSTETLKPAIRDALYMNRRYIR